jgi:glycosyltransferase involved in cell wall biosynthesis
MLQPFPDGVSSRRTTVMAGIAHGRPVVTTSGPLTEPIWAESGAVDLVPVAEVGQISRRVETLLADSSALVRLGAEGRALYERAFAWDRTVEQLNAP